MRLRVNNDAGLAPPGFNCDPHFGELIVNNATGLTITTPAASVIANNATGNSDAVRMVAGQSFGLTLSATTGLITVTRPGLYAVWYGVHTLGAVSTQTLAFEVYVSGATVGSTNALKSGVILTTATSTTQLAGQGILSLAAGATLSLVVTEGVTTSGVTLKYVRLGCFQLTDQAVSPTT